MRRWPLNLARAPSSRQRPCQRCRLAAIARIAPIGVPAFIDRLPQDDREPLPRRHRRARGMQAHIDLARPRQWLRRGNRAKEQGEEEDRQRGKTDQTYAHTGSLAVGQCGHETFDPYVRRTPPVSLQKKTPPTFVGGVSWNFASGAA